MPRKKRRAEGPGLIEQLRERIRASGMQLKQLGEAAGVDPSQLSRFMRAERSLTLPAVEKLCFALGLHLAGDPDAPPAKPKAPRKAKGKRGEEE